MKLIYTRHALSRMTRRNIGNANVLAVLVQDKHPEPIEEGRLRYQYAGLNVIAAEKKNSTVIVSVYYDGDK